MVETIPSVLNQVVNLQAFEDMGQVRTSVIFKFLWKLTHMKDGFDNCPSCDQYLFFLITANIEVNKSVVINATGLSYNIAQGK